MMICLRFRGCSGFIAENPAITQNPSMMMHKVPVFKVRSLIALMRLRLHAPLSY